MAFKLKSFQELVAMTKEKFDEALIPLRVEAAKNRAQGEVIKIKEQLLNLETKINEACAKKDIDNHAAHRTEFKLVTGEGFDDKGPIATSYIPTTTAQATNLLCDNRAFVNNTWERTGLVSGVKVFSPEAPFGRDKRLLLC